MSQAPPDEPRRQAQGEPAGPSARGGAGGHAAVTGEALPESGVESRLPCPNCATLLLGPWCHGCGQAQTRRRLEIGDLVQDLFAGLFNWERGFLRTVKDLTLRPGQTARDYVAGRRRTYVSPLKYQILVTAAFLILMGALGIELLDFNPAATSSLPTGDPFASELTKGLMTTMEQVMRFLTITSVPIFAWVSGLVFRSRGYNFAEHCSFWLYALTQLTVLFSVPLLFLALNRFGGLPWLPLLLNAAWLGWAARGFYRTSWLLGSVVALACYALFIGLVGSVLVGSLMTAILVS